MLGPVGTPIVGTAPRLGDTNSHNNEPPLPTHSQGVPSAAFNCAGVTALACPVAESAIHSSMPLSRWCVNAKRLPSGEKPIHDSIGLGGSVTFLSAPSATAFSVIARASCARCGPLVRGLMRTPAMRCIGCASCAMVGMLTRSSSAITSRDGLTSTVGGGGRSEEHTSELQSPCNLVCRLLLEKKKNQEDNVEHRHMR